MEEVTLGQPISRRIQTSINSHSERLPSPVLFAWAFVALRELEYAHCDASSGYSWEVSTMPITVTIKSMKEWFQHTVQSTLLVLSQVQPASVQSTVCHFLSFAHRNRTWICCSFRDFHLVLTRRNDEHRFGCCRRYIDVQEEDKTSSILDVWPILSLLSKRWTTPLTNGLETCLDRLRPSKSEGIVDDTRGIQQHWWEGNGSTQQGNHATRFQNLCVGSWGLFLFLTNWVPYSHGHAEFSMAESSFPVSTLTSEACSSDIGLVPWKFAEFIKFEFWFGTWLLRNSCLASNLDEIPLCRHFGIHVIHFLQHVIDWR